MNASLSAFIEAISVPHAVPPYISPKSSFADNHPWYSATNFGKGKNPDYYFLDQPSPYQLWKTARSTPIGWRLTYGVAQDEWANNFKITFETIDKQELDDLNDQIRPILEETLFFDEGRKARGYEREQGESLLFFHRLNTLDFDPVVLRSPADENSEVVRVEAIHSTNYEIMPDGEYYRLTFTESGFGKQMYLVHKSHCIRLRPRHYDYDQYKSDQSFLRPVFGHIQILLNISLAAGDAAHRWGNGLPIVWVKNITDENDLERKKRMVGNPNRNSWLMLPKSLFEGVDMAGIQGTQIDLHELYRMIIDSIVAYCKIPRPILMGEVAGVVTGSEVNERSYFAVLDQGHTEMNSWVIKGLLKYPRIRALLGDRKIQIDWGLRQVMSKFDLAQYENLLYVNAGLAMQYSTWNECRRVAKLPPWEEVVSDEICLKYYGISAADMGKLPAMTVQTLLTGFNPGSPENPTEPLYPTEDPRNNGALPSSDQTEEEEMQNNVKAQHSIQFAVASYQTKRSMNQLADALGVSKATAYRITDKAWNDLVNDLTKKGFSEGEAKNYLKNIIGLVPA